MSIEDRVRELNGGAYTKKSYSVEEVQAILGITRQTVYTATLLKLLQNPEMAALLKTLAKSL